MSCSIENLDGNLYKEFGFNKDKYTGYVVYINHNIEKLCKMLKEFYPNAWKANFGPMMMNDVEQLYVNIFINNNGKSDIKLSCEGEGIDPDDFTDACNKFYLPVLLDYKPNSGKAYYEGLQGALLNALQYYFTRVDLNDDNRKIYLNYIK